MDAILWYGGAIGIVLCVALSIVKIILLALGSDTYPKLSKLADKLPPTQMILFGQIFFLILMVIPLFIP